MATGDDVLLDVGVGSLHPPNHPGFVHVVRLVGVGYSDVIVGPGVAEGVESVVVVVGSLQPNHPGVWHVVVEVDVLTVVVVVAVAVVVLSRHPHQPGVWQVDVLVGSEDVVVVVLVIGSEPLLSMNFQLTQSKQTLSGSHFGTVSYFSMTSEITDRIRWVPIPTRQPRSSTVS